MGENFAEVRGSGNGQERGNPLGLSDAERTALIKQQEEGPKNAVTDFKFKRIPLPRLCRYLDHAIVETDAQHAKLVFRFVSVPESRVPALSKLLWKLVHNTNVPESEALFDESPVIAMSYDFVQFFVPRLTVESVHRYLLTELTKEFA